jgi:hypothetical protein
MRTKIRRPYGNEVCVGAIPADALTKHDIGAFQEVHRRARTEQITDRLLQLGHRQRMRRDDSIQARVGLR